MSSRGISLPPVSISDVRSTEAANRVKSSSQASREKIEKSAKEFEAVLLSHWLDQAEQSFATVPGSDLDEDTDPGRDQFHSIAMQAVGSALSGGRGGLGIATMVARHLEAARNDRVTSVSAAETKDLQGKPVSGSASRTPEGTK